MPTGDFTVIYSGASFRKDRLKSLLEGSGIEGISKMNISEEWSRMPEG